MWGVSWASFRSRCSRRAGQGSGVGPEVCTSWVTDLSPPAQIWGHWAHGVPGASGPSLQARLPELQWHGGQTLRLPAAPPPPRGCGGEAGPAGCILTPRHSCPRALLPPPRRLLHYFRGRHHLEIMYNENTRRSQLLALVDKFRSVLVVTTHEDRSSAVFQALLT